MVKLGLKKRVGGLAGVLRPKSVMKLEVLKREKIGLERVGKAKGLAPRENMPPKAPRPPYRQTTVQLEEIGYLKSLKEETNRLIGEKNSRSTNLKALLSQYNETLRELREKEKKVVAVESRTSAMRKEIGQKLEEIDRKEREMLKREHGWIWHNKLINESREMLIAEKERLSQDVKAKKAELYLIKEGWDRKNKDFKEELAELKKERDKLKGFIDADLKVLEEKESELIKLFSGIEKDKSMIEHEENSISDKIRKLERLQKDLRLKELRSNTKDKQLLARERIISKAMKYIAKEKIKVEEAKELKKQLPAMKALQKKLELYIDIGRREAIDAVRENSGFKRLLEREKDLKERERTIEKDIMTFKQREIEIEKLERREGNAFRDYVHEELETAKGEIAKEESKHPELHALKDDVQRRLEQGDSEGAISLLAQLELLVNKIKDTEEKRMMMYDIKEIKANIKLSMLV